MQKCACIHLSEHNTPPTVFNIMAAEFEFFVYNNLLTKKESIYAFLINPKKFCEEQIDEKVRSVQARIADEKAVPVDLIEILTSTLPTEGVEVILKKGGIQLDEPLENAEFIEISNLYGQSY